MKLKDFWVLVGFEPVVFAFFSSHPVRSFCTFKIMISVKADDRIESKVAAVEWHLLRERECIKLASR